MSDLGGVGTRRMPTAAEVIGQLKDDGDFDALRRAIIRKVRDNEVLRNATISEVKQSVVLQEDGSEKSKMMGQISDEVWNVIQSNETDIRGTVAAVYNRIVIPEQDPEPSSKKPKRNGKEEQVPSAKTPTSVTIEVEDDLEEPPGFGFSDNQRNSIAATTMLPLLQQPSNLENHKEMNPNGGEPDAVGSPGGCDDDGPDVPPGFG